MRPFYRLEANGPKSYAGVLMAKGNRQIVHSQLQADPATSSWGPRRPPRGCSKRPTVVLEVVVSVTERKLHRDVDLWLDPVIGNANIAMAIKLNRQRPLITIEMWE